MRPTTHPDASPATRKQPPPTLGRRETIEGLLTQTRRGIVPIRKTFVQQGRGKATTPGPLASFLRAHDDRGLEAYLFLHAMASASTPWNCVLPSGAWVRALGLAENATPASARGAFSKIMKRLMDRKLIERSRSKRRADVRLLREDASGESYERPLGKERWDRWMQLPHAYWREGHFESLHLPAKVMLLVALSLDDGFYLPSERAPDWYGVSADSADEGLRELRQAGLLDTDYQWERNVRSDTGWTKRWTYTLIGSFSKDERKKAAASRSVDDEPDDMIEVLL